MGSLNNLYISQSYQSLLHFATDWTASATLTEIQDGLGNGTGLYLNNSGSASVTADFSVGGDLIVSGTFDIEGAVVIRDNVYITGSTYVSGDISSSRVLAGQITASNLRVDGTLTAYEIHTIIESSSIIFSSGSNILGDSTADIQTLNGKVIVSGSEEITGSLQVSAAISSSTITGIGNVTAYSQSVSSSILILSQSVSASQYAQDVKINLLQIATGSLNQFTASLVTTFVTTASLDATASFLQNQIDQKLFTSSFNAYTSSTNIRLNNLESTSASVNTSIANINTFTSSVNSRFTTLGLLTGSYATTGSNTFVGNEIISGSIRGVVIPITITAATASMDCSLGNFFTLTLAGGTNTRLVATNILPGETISLKVTQPATTGSISYPSYIKFPNFGNYSASLQANAVDILTFITFDSTNLYGVNVKNMI